MSKGILFSENLPDYLKLDLGVGSDRENPITKAINNALESYTNFSLSQLYALDPTQKADSLVSHVLTSMGFDLAGLSKAQVKSFYNALPVLVHSRGQLACIQHLADVYFRSAKVLRGRTASQQKTYHRFRVVDRHANRNTMTVSLNTKEEATLVASFLSNASFFVPHGTQIFIAHLSEGPPSTQKQQRLDRNKLKKRRLLCPTLQR